MDKPVKIVIVIVIVMAGFGVGILGYQSYLATQPKDNSRVDRYIEQNYKAIDGWTIKRVNVVFTIYDPQVVANLGTKDCGCGSSFLSYYTDSSGVSTCLKDTGILLITQSIDVNDVIGKEVIIDKTGNNVIVFATFLSLSARYYLNMF